MSSSRASVLVSLAIFALSFGDDSLEIKTKFGKVKGFTKVTFGGVEVDTYLGIPYAAPPTGQNRFAPPKDPEPWRGTLDATIIPRPCYQVIDEKWKLTEFVSSLEGTEDCLKLNIWASKHRTGKSAVMVWIYGGSFTCGSIDLAIYDGSNLAAQEDVIVVSVNYRLSAFGFLYLEHPQAPANVGLMDQAFGLQWVKKNIQAFGGDPERVTIFGESAGGVAVRLQLLAPSSLELFKNAILMSGTGADFWATFTPKEALGRSLLLAEKAGCPVQEERREETIRCLQGISGDKLYSSMMEFGGHPLKMAFRPVVDGKFLPSEPSQLLSEGRFCGEKNVLIGYTKEDGSFMLHFCEPHLDMEEDFVYSEEQILQVMSTFTKKDGKISGLQLDLVKHLYTDWNNTEDKIAARDQMIHFLTDRWFACPSIVAANKLANKGNQVFMYRFDQVPTKAPLLKVPRWMGSSHADELGFVFGHLAEKQDSEDAKVSRHMMRYWANFAKTGDPNDEYLPTWPKYDSKNKLMLTIDGKGLAVTRNERTRECAFWEQVFPKTEEAHKTDV